MFSTYPLCSYKITKWKWKTLEWHLIQTHLYAVKSSLMPNNFLLAIPTIPKRQEKLANHFISFDCCCCLFSISFHSIQFKREMRWKMAQELYANWFENFITQDTVCLSVICVCVLSRDVKNEWMSVCHGNLKQIAENSSVSVPCVYCVSASNMWAASQKKQNKTNGPLLYMSKARSTWTIEEAPRWVLHIKIALENCIHFLPCDRWLCWWCWWPGVWNKIHQRGSAFHHTN